MTSSVREMLDGMAAGARVYPDPDRAVAVARRRRRSLAVVGAAAVAALVAGVGTAVWLPARRPLPEVAVGGVSWLPSEVVVPSQQPRELPADRPVGAAALVYRPCAGLPCEGGYHVMLPSGEQFRLPAGVAAPTLSRNGRWLGYTEPGPPTPAFVVRDLTGKSSIRVPGKFTRGTWSPDGRWLLLYPHHETAAPDDNDVVLADTLTGQQQPVART